MNKLILSFILGAITTFFLVGGIDYIVQPDYPSQWEESITVPSTFSEPWMPLAFIIIGALGGAVLVLLFCPCDNVYISQRVRRE